MMQQQMLAVQSLPPQIAQQAEAYQLGTLNNVYKPRISNPLAVLGIAGGIFLADIILILLILLATGYIFYILLFILIIAIAYAITGLMNCNLRVYEFTHGLIKAKGSTLEFTHWNQIESVWQEIKANNSAYFAGGLLGALIFGGRTKTLYRVRRRDGATLVFDSQLQNLETLGLTIHREVAQAHMPQAIIAFEGGLPIPFGPLTISQQGIANKKGTILPWFQVRGVKVDKNVVTILQNERAQKWISTPLAKVPNVSVLTGLVDYAMRGAQ